MPPRDPQPHSHTRPHQGSQNRTAEGLPDATARPLAKSPCAAGHPCRTLLDMFTTKPHAIREAMRLTGGLLCRASEVVTRGQDLSYPNR